MGERDKASPFFDCSCSLLTQEDAIHFKCLESYFENSAAWTNYAWTLQANPTWAIYAVIFRRCFCSVIPFEVNFCDPC